jgi:molybdate transport system substrate-binding protein
VITRAARPAILTSVGILLLAAGCGGDSDDGASEGETVTVLAASSLTETFTELEGIYQEEHEGVDVRISFDSSSTLAGQAIEGAPADVLATADEATMAMATDADVTAEEPQLFATNTMVMVAPAGNLAGIVSFEDLNQEGITYIACEKSAPCGALAKTLLDANQIEAAPSSFEVDVKAVLTKVELDEADAGLVYESDAVASGDKVETIEIPMAEQEINNYPIATLTQSENPDLATDWVDLVLSEEGQGILGEAGFGAP